MALNCEAEMYSASNIYLVANTEKSLPTLGMGLAFGLRKMDRKDYHWIASCVNHGRGSYHEHG